MLYTCKKLSTLPKTIVQQPVLISTIKQNHD